MPTSWNHGGDLLPESGDLVGGKIIQAGQKKEPMEAGWGRIKEASECRSVDSGSQSRALGFCQPLDVGRGHGHVKARQWAPNGMRLSCGALKKNSFLNLRAPPASSACWTARLVRFGEHGSHLGEVRTNRSQCDVNARGDYPWDSVTMPLGEETDESWAIEKRAGRIKDRP